MTKFEPGDIVKIDTVASPIEMTVVRVSGDQVTCRFQLGERSVLESLPAVALVKLHSSRGQEPRDPEQAVGVLWSRIYGAVRTVLSSADVANTALAEERARPLAERNGWTDNKIKGYADGRAVRLKGKQPSRYALIGAGDYNEGYRAGYFGRERSTPVRYTAADDADDSTPPRLAGRSM